jgi:hypothetical protein
VIQRSLNLRKYSMGVPWRKVVLPYSQNRPSLHLQLPRHVPVSGLVCGQLLAPEFSVVGWRLAVLRAAMPETSIDKHGYSALPEDKIWLAEHSLPPPPACDVMAAKKYRKGQFGVLVS